MRILEKTQMTARRIRTITGLTATIAVLGIVQPGVMADDFATPLPAGVTALWDLKKAYRETTPTRERFSLNGLWRWQPAEAQANPAPTEHWGYFKVPGCWPGITDYLQKDSQTLYVHPSWKDKRLAGLAAAWYEREIAIPPNWTGRRISLSLEVLNSYAAVFVDGKQAGEIRFPGGELELTPYCHPGATYRLSLLVVAIPLKGVMLAYRDTNVARQVEGAVPRRGLCGDVYLVSTPPGVRIADFRVGRSIRDERVTFDAAVSGLAADRFYSLGARITLDGRDVFAFISEPFTIADMKRGRITYRAHWKPERLWDLHTPANFYSVRLSLHGAPGKALDTAFDARVGFREFKIDGRDFFLNGSRIYLSAVPLDNAQVGAAQASYSAARESLERLKSFGINMVYTHNYGCEPGSHLSFAEVLRAADDVGMLVSFSQPHFAHYEWRGKDADQSNGYRQHAERYVHMAQNHPSVVFYSMSHNATGYDEDMNPDLIDGRHDPRDSWASNNTKLALRAEAIVRDLDPSRVVYHHSSGNLGSMHTSNFYPNFAPIQELSDWFEHWAKTGVKPVFTCEYGAPFTWDWSLYRGWYKGQRNFGSARVPWEFCFAEWNSQFLGDRAFRLSEMEKANLRWEAKQFRAGNLWHRWDYPYEIGSTRFDDRHEVIGMYLTDNLRAFRTWGVSATSPWEFGHFWRPKGNVDRSRKALPVDWENLQRPGFSPDYVEQPFERFDQAFARSDWIATADGHALMRNNQPLLAYIGGPESQFTSKDHNFRPGETVHKQLIVINNSREPVTCDCSWSAGFVEGSKAVTVATGQQERIPIRIDLPAAGASVKYALEATIRFSTGEIQRDSFELHVIPGPPISRTESRIALFDPKGESGAMLKAMDVSFQPVDSNADLSAFDMLIVGKSALTTGGPAPGIGRVRDGLKVVVFEQDSQVLEQRLGFRVVEYGLRQVFPRVPDHRVLKGINVEHLRDWRGEATITPARLKYETRPRFGPTVKWCDIPVTRVWRCGNRGNVASVLIEKPSRGDFLPIVDGGFSLQFSPLLEHREGQGMILFCQLDVTARTQSDPAALDLMRNTLNYVSTWRPAQNRTVVYAGDGAGLSHLAKAGITAMAFDGAALSPDQVLVVGPGGGQILASSAPAVADWLSAGGNLLAIGLDAQEANSFLPLKLQTRSAEHISGSFDLLGREPWLVGIGPADLHNRDPRDVQLTSGGAAIKGDGALATVKGMNLVFCQLAPWQWKGDGTPNVKRTYRRVAFLLSRLLANMGVRGDTPILDRFATPVATDDAIPRWRDGLYLDKPEESDDPYRFFRW
jgi:beta-galactosidase